MTQDAYTPNANFSETGNVDPTSLDAELQNIADSLSSTQTALASLIRDDNQLKDGLIRDFMLSSEVRNLMAKGVNPKGVWQTGNGYVPGDLVQVGDDSWLCLASHTADSVFANDSNYWVIFSRAVELAPGVVLGDSSVLDVGTAANNLMTVSLLDARFVKAGAGGLYQNSSAGSHIIDPIGAYGTLSGTHTGPLEIRFPQPWKDAHVRMIVDILLEGTSGSQLADSLTVILTGRQVSAGPAWQDVQAHVVDGTSSTQIVPIRWGYGSDGHPRIWLGADSTEWLQPSIKIRELFIGGSDNTASLWRNGWSITFESAAQSVLQTINTAGISQLPNMTGSSQRYLRVNSTGTAVEYRTSNQVLSDINAIGGGPNDGDGYIWKDGGWISLESGGYNIPISSGLLNGDLEVNGGIGGAEILIRADTDDDSDLATDMPQLRFLFDANAEELILRPNAAGDLILQKNGGSELAVLTAGDLSSALAAYYTATEVDNIFQAVIPDATTALFVMASAPTGWTKSLTHNNKALRVVSGNGGGGGGTNPFTTAFNSAMGSTSSGAHTHSGSTGLHTLTAAQSGLPLHNHPNVPSILAFGTSGSNIVTVRNVHTAPTAATGNAGGTDASQGHDHSISSDGSHSHTTNLNVQYVDAIICVKDAY